MSSFTRRTALLTVLVMPLGYFRAFAAQTGWLIINLDQWTGIKVRLAGKEVIVTNIEVFEALTSEKEGK